MSDLVSDEDTEEQVELVEVDLAGAVRVEHVEHVVDLFRLQVGQMPDHVVELNVYTHTCRQTMQRSRQQNSPHPLSSVIPRANHNQSNL